MSQLFPVLEQTAKITTNVEANRLLKFASADGEMALATSAADLPAAISRRKRSAGDRDDVGVIGIFPCEYGGNVTRGQRLTSDASGRGVLATAGDEVHGIAWESGVLGTIGSILKGGPGMPGPQGEPGE